MFKQCCVWSEPSCLNLTSIYWFNSPHTAAAVRPGCSDWRSSSWRTLTTCQQSRSLYQTTWREAGKLFSLLYFFCIYFWIVTLLVASQQTNIKSVWACIFLSILPCNQWRELQVGPLGAPYWGCRPSWTDGNRATTESWWTDRRTDRVRITLQVYWQFTQTLRSLCITCCVTERGSCFSLRLCPLRRCRGRSWCSQNGSAREWTVDTFLSPSHREEGLSGYCSSSFIHSFNIYFIWMCFWPLES